MNTLLIIDGENFKGKLKTIFKEVEKAKPAWHLYDFKGLFSKVLKGFVIEESAFYFARIKEHEKSKIKSRQLIEEQRLLKTHLEKQGFKVILSGRVRGQMEVSSTGKPVLVFREKGVDVKIGVDIVSLSCDKKVKEIILCSSDSDLQPAIQEARKRDVKCVYLGFEIQPNKGISYTTSRTILIRNSEVLEFEGLKKFTLQLENLKALNLPPNEFIVVGSGSLAVRGIREAKDVDIVVTESLWNVMSKKYKVELNDWGVERLCLPHDIEILNPKQSIFGNSKIVPFKGIFNNADVFDGIKFLDLEHLKMIKLKLGRPIDLQDIKLIDKYLQAH